MLPFSSNIKSEDEKIDAEHQEPHEPEFEAEESGEKELEEEFNQESEELLDIPTFLRRQAN